MDSVVFRRLYAVQRALSAALFPAQASGSVARASGERHTSAASAGDANASAKQQKRMVTMNEVKNHNRDSDCWTVIAGKVYDVTEYILEHPGGDLILEGAGGDSTDMFDDMGHSEEARDMLADFYVGDLIVA